MKISESFTAEECRTAAFAMHHQWLAMKVNWDAYMLMLPREMHATLKEQRLGIKRLALRFKKLARQADKLEFRNAG